MTPTHSSRAAAGGWTTWRAAESAIGRPRALQRALGKLPERQAWILRGLDALDRGKPDELRALADEAGAGGQLALARILALCLSAPEQIDPSAVRKAAKSQGLPNGPGFPLLDLMRLFAVRLAGLEHTRPASLAKAARERPVLQALLSVLSTKFARYGFHRALSGLSPRLPAYWLAAVARITAQPDTRALLRTHLLDPKERFPAELWPDLDEARPQVELWSWLKGSASGGWSPALAEQLRACWRAPREERAAVLGLLLARIDSILRAGRPADAHGPVRAALGLLETKCGIEDEGALVLQLVQVALRLEWFLPSEPSSADLAAALWRSLRDAPIAERLAVARVLLDGAAPGALDARMRAELVLVRAVHAQERGERSACLLSFASDVTHARLEAAFPAEIDALERRLLGGVLHVGQRDYGRALEVAAELAVRAGGMEGTAELVALVASCAGRLRARGALGPAAEALARSLCGRTPTPALALSLPALLRLALPSEEARRWTARLRPECLAAFDPLPEPPDPRVASALIGLAQLGGEERAQELFRRVGRHLARHASDPAAWKLALLLVGRCTDLASDPQSGGLFDDWAESLTTFLLHRGPEALAARVSELLRQGPPESLGVALWALENEGQLGTDPVWRQLALESIQAHGDDDPEAAAHVAAAHGLEPDPFDGEIDQDELFETLSRMLHGGGFE